MFVSMNIAVIGNSSFSYETARGLSHLGHQVNIGVKDNEISIASYICAGMDNVQVYNITDAATDADVIVICTRAEDVRESAYWLGDIRNTVIIDTTNAPELRSVENVNTLSAIKAITGSPHVVKCFRCTSYADLIKPLFNGAPIDTLMAGDSKKAKQVAALLIRDLGFSNCHDFGDSTTLPLLEEMVRCWHDLIVAEEEQKQKTKVLAKVP